MSIHAGGYLSCIVCGYHKRPHESADNFLCEVIASIILIIIRNPSLQISPLRKTRLLLIKHSLTRSSHILQILLHILIKLVQWLERNALSPEHISLNEPRQPSVQLVSDETFPRHSKDVVQLFQRPLLRLWQPEEDHEKRRDVQSSVEAECAGWRKLRENTRE